MKSSPTRRRQGALLHESSLARKPPRLKSQLDDRDAHPPAMRWLFGEYTAAEAGNRPGLGRPTRRGGGSRTCRRQAADREQVPSSSTISPRTGSIRGDSGGPQ